MEVSATPPSAGLLLLVVVPVGWMLKTGVGADEGFTEPLEAAIDIGLTPLCNTGAITGPAPYTSYLFS